MTSPDSMQVARCVADRQAITEAIYRYCRAMDRCDAGLGYSIWNENAEADYGILFRGTGRGFIDFALQAHHAGLLMHSHQVTNILIELAGDLAHSESYVTAALRRQDGARLMQTTARGRYLDRWARRDGRWGIDKRTYVHDFDEDREIAATAFAGWGRRDHDDPSYRTLTGRTS